MMACALALYGVSGSVLGLHRVRFHHRFCARQTDEGEPGTASLWAGWPWAARTCSASAYSGIEAAGDGCLPRLFISLNSGLMGVGI